VGALGHYLEEEGIPTTQISLVREHTAALVPPRALWVPFILGRPFGAPNDAAFQARVLDSALRLLERATGPVLVDFPEDAPHTDLGDPPEGLTCPVSFPRMNSEGTLAERLVAEVAQLQAWHDLAVGHRGRTTLGVTGLSPGEIAEFLGTWLTGAPKATFSSGVSSADALKRACDELRAFYYEAKSAQPGRHTSAAMQDWFWMETAAGEALREIRARAALSEDAAVKTLVATSLVPRAVDAAIEAARSGSG
jgi:hypothetical protein